MKTNYRLASLILLMICLFVGHTALAQDIIVKKDGSTVLSKVSEVGTSEIKYKKWSNLDGPLYTIRISEILSINYENGEKEMFAKSAQQVQQQTQQPVQQTLQQNLQPATTTTDTNIQPATGLLTEAELTPEPEGNQVIEDYRRSSLCLLLVTNKGDKYAKAIEQQFLAMPLPNRYNSLNVDVRVLNVSKSTNEKRVSKLLKDQSIAKQLVGKWFNRNNSGMMNMDRIHEWGGYNASFEDLKRAQSTERGLALLSDEGAELIKNTFVMVCDISYYDRQNTGLILAGVFAGMAGMAGSYAAQEARKGNVANAQMWNSLKETGMTGAIASTDIAGFSVNVMAYLYRLNWNDKLRDAFYSNYWVDQSTPASEASQRRVAFDADKSSFQLEFLGQYRSRAGKTVSKSANASNMGSIIREVCADAVDNSINNLAKMFPVFKPKTAFYCKDNNIYAYIGTKEGVTSKSKYEMIETEKTAKGFEYKRVGTWKPSYIWDNKDLLISTDSLEQKYNGTSFLRTSGKQNVCDQGLLLREMGKLGYQYKKHRVHFSLNIGAPSISDDMMKDVKIYRKNPRDFSTSGPVFNLECGWLINYHTNFAWNPINFSMGFGANDYIGVSGTTGAMVRTNPLGSHGRFALFAWPSIGLRVIGFDTEYKYTDTERIKYISGYYTYSGKPKYDYKYNYITKTDKAYINAPDDLSIFEWNVKLGITLGEQWMLGVHIGDIFKGGFVSFCL